MDLKSEGINVGLAVAGIFGALLTASKRAGEDVGRSILSIVGGAASANYVTPLILKITKLEDTPESAYAIAFLLGFAGLRAVEVLSNKLFPHESPQSAHSRKRTR